MKHCLGLLFILSILTTGALAASTTLFLKASLAPSFRIETSSGMPVLITNVKEGLVKPEMRVEKIGDITLVTVIHP